MFPIDVTVQGQALEDFGLEALNTIDGIGLLTMGLLWSCDAIWAPLAQPITTTWTNPMSGTVETCIDD